MPVVVQVNPRKLLLLSSRQEGAEPRRLHSQMATFGRSFAGMPPIQVLRTTDGEYIIQNGVTRATRMAMLEPGRLIYAEVVGDWPKPSRYYRKLEETLP